MAHDAGEVTSARRGRAVGWWALFGVCAVVGALALVVVVEMLLAQAGLWVSGGDVPTGHPHGEISGGEVAITCASTIGYAAGDRDPLCQSTSRIFAGVAVAALLVVVACGFVGRWSVRRARRKDGAPDGRRRALSRAAGGLATLVGAAVVVVCVLALVLPTNRGKWVESPSRPPPVPGLQEWRDRVGPLTTEMASEVQDITVAFKASPSPPDPADCAALGGTVDSLADAILGAPDPELAAASERAIEQTQRMVTACEDAARDGTLGSEAAYAIQSTSAALEWSDVADRVLELRLGPG